MMRKVSRHILLPVVCLVAFGGLFASCKREADEPAQAGSGDISSRIQRVENGLVAPVVIRGRSPAPMKLSDRMKHHEVPGVGIAVIDGHGIEWARGYGVTEAGSDRPVTTDTLFQAASTSKPVVAMAALHLVQQGRLELDEDVNEKLRSWKVPENEYTKKEKATLRRLLSHSAGMSVHGFMGYAPGEKVPTLLQVLDGRKPANSQPVRVDMVPGSKWRYAGGGFCVLQQLLVDVTGKPFPELMQDAVLGKLGMKRSTFQQPIPSEAASSAATGHRSEGDRVRGRWHTYPEMAAAGLWTTPSDLALFVIELLRSARGESNRVLSREMTDLMLFEQIEGSGLGIFVQGEGRSERFSHAGRNAGFTCHLVGYPGSGQGAVVMTNSDNGTDLIQEILRSIAREHGWPGVDRVGCSLRLNRR